MDESRVGGPPSDADFAAQRLEPRGRLISFLDGLGMTFYVLAALSLVFGVIAFASSGGDQVGGFARAAVDAESAKDWSLLGVGLAAGFACLASGAILQALSAILADVAATRTWLTKWDGLGREG
jgi:hypothetical protein